MRQTRGCRSRCGPVGATLMVVAGVTARTVLVLQEIPIGVVTALAGTPLLLVLLAACAPPRTEGGGPCCIVCPKFSEAMENLSHIGVKKKRSNLMAPPTVPSLPLKIAPSNIQTS
nr:iron chelate uptake ABC transporter family permease subunit [Corynebacterium macginleyi]